MYYYVRRLREKHKSFHLLFPSLKVTWGLCLQFAFALLILRWPPGKAVFDCIGLKIDRFLGFTNEGSGFVFGYLVHQNIFNTDKLVNSSLAYNITSQINLKKAVPGIVVFSALSVIYFFSFVVNILFHYGIVQWLTIRIGWLLRKTIGEEKEDLFHLFRIFFNLSFFLNRYKHSRIYECGI